jgi:hypothetical protein
MKDKNGKIISAGDFVEINCMQEMGCYLDPQNFLAVIVEACDGKLYTVEAFTFDGFPNPFRELEEHADPNEYFNVEMDIRGNCLHTQVYSDVKAFADAFLQLKSYKKIAKLCKQKDNYFKNLKFLPLT